MTESELVFQRAIKEYYDMFTNRKTATVFFYLLECKRISDNKHYLIKHKMDIGHESIR